jgi:hypothetical protein
MKLNTGETFIRNNKKPKFSEITTILKMDQTLTSQTIAISIPVF